jgi:hypothetical protein
MELVWLLLLSAGAQAWTPQHNASLYWGSYKPNLYFGLRTRSGVGSGLPPPPENTRSSLQVGLLWGSPLGYNAISGERAVRAFECSRQAVTQSLCFRCTKPPALRYTCEQSDNFARWGWTRHDGRTFGSEEFYDVTNNVLLKAEFLKLPGGDHGEDPRGIFASTHFHRFSSVADLPHLQGVIGLRELRAFPLERKVRFQAVHVRGR